VGEFSIVRHSPVQQLKALGPQAGPIYGGFFDAVPGGTLHHGDSDSKRIFGGHHRPKLAITPVDDLQDDLKTIGYSIGSRDGEFDDETRSAVEIFQEHFWAGGRGGKPTGKADLQTAYLIKSVRMGAPVTQSGAAAH